MQEWEEQWSGRRRQLESKEYILKHTWTRDLIAPSKYTYTKAYEQCLEWDGHPLPLPWASLHSSSLVHTMYMGYLISHFPTNHMNLFKPYSRLIQYAMTTSNLMLYLIPESVENETEAPEHGRPWWTRAKVREYNSLGNKDWDLLMKIQLLYAFSYQRVCS